LGGIPVSLQIILKNSSVSGKEPTASQLANGELALNYHADGPFISCKDSAGTVRRIAGVWISTTAPTSPTPGEFWLDTNTDPAKLKVYKDGTDTWIDTISVVAASTTAAGVVELATDAETQAGTDTLRAVTPASLQSKVSDSTTTTSSTTIASSTAVKSAKDVADAALPAAGGTISGNLTVSGDLTVNGTTTTIDTTTLIVEDKNIEMGAVDTPTDVTADGGGITLKGTTDKTINWVDSTDSWTSSENVDLASGKTYKIAGTDVLSATALGSAVQISSANIPSGTIVNDDVNASAAIAGTKINPNFGSQNTITTGTSTAASFIPSSSTAPTDGLYLPSTNQVAISTNGTGRLFVDASGDIKLGSAAAAGFRLAVDGDTWFGNESGVEIGRLFNDAGVLHLRASSNVTGLALGTNGAEKVRIDSSGRLLVGTATSALEKLVIKADGGGIQINRNDSGSPTSGQALGSIGFKGIVSANSNVNAEVLIQAAADEDHSASTAGSRLEFYTKPSGTGPGSSPTERMRIDSSGRLLVGTLTASSAGNSQYAYVQIQGGPSNSAWGGIALRRNEPATSIVSGEAIGQVIYSDSTGNDFARIECFADADAGSGDYPGRLAFSTTANAGSSPTERMRINSSGNVGIGTGTTSPTNKLVVSNGGAEGFEVAPGATVQTYSYNRSTSAYVQHTDLASSWLWNNGTTDRMVLDSSGNLGLGTNSPSQSLDIQAVSSINIPLVVRSGSSQTNSFIAINDPGTTSEYSNRIGCEGDNLVFWTNGGEKARMDSSGRVGIGTTSGLVEKLHVNGGVRLDADNQGIYFNSSTTSVIGNGTNSEIYFYTSNAEKARIDSSGRLGIGTTSPDSGSLLHIANTGGIAKQTIESANNSQAYINLSAQSSEASFGYVRDSGGNGSLRFCFANDIVTNEKLRISADGYVYYGGNVSTNVVATRAGSAGQLILVANSGGLFHQTPSTYYLVSTAGGSTSDATLKTNIQPLTNALDKIDQIRGVNFTFIDTPLCGPDQGQQIGVIAQEVETVFPEIVVTDEEGIKSVRYDRLVAPLIEALKEAKERIETLEAKVTALENS
jgi:hypothetical protein